jgi:hypothetical protein
MPYDLAADGDIRAARQRVIAAHHDLVRAASTKN